MAVSLRCMLFLSRLSGGGNAVLVEPREGRRQTAHSDKQNRSSQLTSSWARLSGRRPVTSVDSDKDVDRNAC